MKRPLLKNPVTGIYHITCRGNNKEFIFDTDQSKRKLIMLLKDCKKKFDFELLAWVIMSNHIHLLLKVNDSSLSTIMHNLKGRYSKWYNQKNAHTGHVFDGPYDMKECVNLNYFLNIIRYIHQNPERAHICETASYLWSSHRDYVNDCPWHITNVDIALEKIHSDFNKSRADYRQFMLDPEIILPKLPIDDIYVSEISDSP